VHYSIKEEFTRRLIQERLSQLKLGDLMDPETTMGPLVLEAAAKGVAADVDKTIAQARRLLSVAGRDGAFYEPTVLVDVTPDMDIARDVEVLGRCGRSPGSTRSKRRSRSATTPDTSSVVESPPTTCARHSRRCGCQDRAGGGQRRRCSVRA
jgi:hypothetical protein